MSRIKLNLFLFIVFIGLTSCAERSTTWIHPSATQAQGQNISDKCWAQANQQSPVYMCRNALMCAPNESGLVISSVANRNNAYNVCMFQYGFTRP
jgi:hypothetical protein